MREFWSTGRSRLPLFLLLAGLMASGSALAAGSATGSSAGGAASGAGKAAGATSSAGGTGRAAGEQLLKSAQPPCITCHQLKAGVEQPGPSLAGIAQRAQQRIKAPGYKGKARDAKAYLRESILDPNAYVVPGATYAAGGKSLMPATYGQTMKPEQVNQLVDYLMTLK
ncbi:MAG: cytochrome c [Pseudomonadota bacterium]